MAAEKKSTREHLYNTHAHCFTINHVPESFAKTMVWFYWLFPISWIKHSSVVRKLIVFLNIKWVLRLLSWMFPKLYQSLPRLLSFVQYFETTEQLGMIKIMQGYYPRKTRFVFLTMDMEYMAAGKPLKDFVSQLDELAKIKADPIYRDHIYPFVFADPRRPDIASLVKRYVEDTEKPFQGIKLYPAIGYYPFDKGLKEVYKYAIQYDLPLITHCIRGVVHYRGLKKDNPDWLTHPISKQLLPGKTNYEFTANFTHPLNYECLLNPALLSEYWDEKINLSALKICLGHFGGEDEWLKYLTDCWLPADYFMEPDIDALNISKIWYDVDGKKAFSWFTIVCELMRKYPNVYADVSYTLCDERIYPLLKILLEDSLNATPLPGTYRIADKVLFGTDFFVVSKAGSEREMSIKLRSALGEVLFDKIARENPINFLNSKLSPVS